MITVGLDFGTHQTKICIEDATNPNQKIYEFFKFFDNGKSTFFLPSVVQINIDGTLSYGTVDENKCKIITTEFVQNSIKDLNPPIQKELPEPNFIDIPSQPIKYSHPEKPKKIPYPIKPSKLAETSDWKTKLLALKNKMQNKENSNDDEWRQECTKIDNNYNLILYDWELKCKRIDKNYKRILQEWESKCQIIKKQNEEIRNNYESDKIKHAREFENAQRYYNYRKNQFHYLSINEKGEITEEKFIFHYFKFALYSEDVIWLHQIDPETISIWYLTHILFLLREKFGEDFFVQMGIPCGIHKKFHEKQKGKAICTLIAAYNLLENYKYHNKFLSSTYKELLNYTKKITHFSELDLNKFGINALPEAYAGLISLTQRRRLEKGMNLLVDIGGGTTDIAFFTIDEEDLPTIHSVRSLFKGLNSIYENVASKSNISDIVNIQNLINNSEYKFGQFKEAILTYKYELTSEVISIINSIRDSFNNSYIIHGLHIGTLNQALLNRPVLFSGGGSTFKELVADVGCFTNPLIINKEMLSITTLNSDIYDEKMFSILSTSYGLSIPLENEIILTDISEIFSHIKPDRDSNSDSNYVHGLTDL
jgi:hypothetical protein